MSDAPQAMTPRDAALLLGVSRDTLSRAVSRGLVRVLARRGRAAALLDAADVRGLAARRAAEREESLSRRGRPKRYRAEVDSVRTCRDCGDPVSLRSRGLCPACARPSTGDGPLPQDPPRMHELHALAMRGLPLFPKKRRDR